MVSVCIIFEYCAYLIGCFNSKEPAKRYKTFFIHIQAESRKYEFVILEFSYLICK